MQTQSPALREHRGNTWYKFPDVSLGMICALLFSRGIARLGYRISLSGLREPFSSENNLANSICCELSRQLTVNGSASYLVDPASSHMLVSKIKPCMS